MHVTTPEIVYPAICTVVIGAIWFSQVGLPLTRQAFARLVTHEPAEIAAPPAEQIPVETELDRGWADNVAIAGPPGATADPLWTADDLAEIRRLAWGDYR